MVGGGEPITTPAPAAAADASQIRAPTPRSMRSAVQTVVSTQIMARSSSRASVRGSGRRRLVRGLSSVWLEAEEKKRKSKPVRCFSCGTSANKPASISRDRISMQLDQAAEDKMEQLDEELLAFAVSRGLTASEAVSAVADTIDHKCRLHGFTRQAARLL
jgi:site-specific recombinase XerC